MYKARDKRFMYLLLLQIWVVAMFASYFIQIASYKELYQDVKEFNPVSAICIDSDRRSTGTGRRRRTRYNNTYQYVVNDHTYQITYRRESSRGSNRTLYYNPNNPTVCSKYASYADAKAKNAILIVIALIGQGVIIFFVMINRQKQKEEQIGNSSVVITDDFNYVMDEPPKQYRDDSTFTTTENERGVETIPFRPGMKRQEEVEVDEVETIAFTRSTKPAEEFTLYTEDEYKQMQKR